MECGVALARIKSGKLYQSKFKTFELYCQERWGFTRQRAYQLISATEAVKKLNDKNVNHGLQNNAGVNGNSSTPPPTPANERQARAMTKEEDEPEKPIEKKEPPLVVDKTDYPMPREIMEDWKKADKIGHEVLNMASKLKCMIEKAREDKDLSWMEISQSATTHAINLYTSLRQLVPHAVCPSCYGHQREGCVLCRKRGFISKFMYESAIPQEMKDLRKKAKK